MLYIYPKGSINKFETFLFSSLYDNFGLLHMDLRKVKELHVSQRKMGYR
jgi:hypothetical protein